MKVILAPISISPEEREFVVDSGTSMHMLSKSDLSPAELDTLRRYWNPTTVVTAHGEVQSNEEAQVYVHDLGVFVTGSSVAGQFRTYCRSRFVIQFRKQFAFNIYIRICLHQIQDVSACTYTFTPLLCAFCC